MHHPVPERGGGHGARLRVADGDLHVAPRAPDAREQLAFETQHLAFQAGEERGDAGFSPLPSRRALRRGLQRRERGDAGEEIVNPPPPADQPARTRTHRAGPSRRTRSTSGASQPRPARRHLGAEQVPVAGSTARSKRAAPRGPPRARGTVPYTMSIASSAVAASTSQPLASPARTTAKVSITPKDPRG